MTILEMLDRLEGEIVELRAKNERLEALAKAGATGRSVSRKSRRTKSKARTKAKTKGKQRTTRPAVVREQKPPTAADGKESRQVGKRQALGRSLLQLRRPSSSETPADIKA